MNTQQAMSVIEQAMQNADSEDPKKKPDFVRALFQAHEALRQQHASESRRASLPRNTGKPWSEEEEARLLELFHEDMELRVIAEDLERTLGAVKARLVRLGELEDPEWSHVKRAEGSEKT